MKTIKVDYSDIKSIINAERKKAELESKGYNLIETSQYGFDVFVLKYDKKNSKVKVKKVL